MLTRSTSIIIPALNEAPVIGQVVERLRACRTLQEAGITDIVVVDNGSDDDTAAVARSAGARVVQEPRRGYGRACLAGVLATQAEIIVLMDGDGSDVPEDIARVWGPVQAGRADLAMGSRARGKCEPGALTPQQRVGNAVGASLLRLLYGARVSDIGPLRAIRRDTLHRLHMAEMTYGWSCEMLAKAGRLGLTILEVPVDYRRRAGGESKVAGTLKGTLKASARILRTITRYIRWQPREQMGLEACVSNGGGESAQAELAASADAFSRDFSRQAGGLSGGTPLAAIEIAEGAGQAAARALFIMARLPIVGQTKTRLGRGIGDEAATALYRAFLADLGERLTHAAAQDGYDLFWCYAAPAGLGEAAFATSVPVGSALIRQQGPDFAARLWHGFQTVCQHGYHQIIVIGTDSPHLPTAWVAQAFEQLQTHQVVIGPAEDGGYYLLGQRAVSAPFDLFTGIPMSTPQVYAQTLARAESLGLRVALAPTTFDVDEPADLDRLRTALHLAPSAQADPAPATLTLLTTLPVAQPADLQGAVHAKE